MRLMLCVFLATLLTLSMASCGGSNPPTKNPVTGNCGNGQVDDGEDCDGSNFDGATCVSRGYSGGNLACTTGCVFDEAGCTNSGTCGNGTIESGEDCDGRQLNEQTCATLNFAGGTLGCATNCKFDTTHCTKCGNNSIDGGEVCDGTALGGATCVSKGFEGGTLACNRSCSDFVTDACVSHGTCGNLTIESPEVCDGTNLGTPAATCRSLNYDSGTLACKSDCTAFDETACVTSASCGDNRATGPEVCDGTDLKGQTCTALGHSGGTLACKAGCRAFDERGCTTGTCGNNRKETGEACDGTDLGGETCMTKGYSAGTLHCATSCTAFDLTACTGGPVCGDNHATGAEACDGTDLKGQTCQNLGFTRGTPACNARCDGFITTGCIGTPGSLCGDGVARGFEVCDGTSWQPYQWGGPACSDFNMGTGNATCTTQCVPSFAACQTHDVCTANNWYNDGVCDACDLLGGHADPDCAALCTLADGTCSSYYDPYTNVYTCQHAGLVDPDCGTCGDGTAAQPEYCDGTDLGGATCADVGFASGSLACATNCIFDFRGCIPPVCGDHTAQGNEPCDGTDLRQQTCATLGFASGNLACKTDCSDFNTQACVTSTCGNNTIETGEACDGTKLNGYTCQRLGFGGGTLSCAAGCKQFNVSACTARPKAGTCTGTSGGQINGLDVCDGSTWGTYMGVQLTGACSDFGLGSSGSLTCTTNCGLSTSSCTSHDVCAAVGWFGDGQYCDACDKLGTNTTPDPDCAALCTLSDGICSDYFDPLAGVWTCRHLGYIDPDCAICGDNQVADSEYCDGTGQSTLACTDYGYTGGTLACGMDCTPTFGSCTSATCGNSTIEAPEVCDRTALGGKTCASLGLGFTGGTLACKADCTGYDTTLCVGAAWTCPTSYYGTGDGCDCGCGTKDPDCTSASASACLYCNDTGSCDAGGTNCSKIKSTNNAVCTNPIPATWKCSTSYYGTGDGCDCGCGAFDPDCGTDHTAAACRYCNNTGSCDATGSNCSKINQSDNSICGGAPAGWRCDPGYYGSNDGCDCGCGVHDPDCTGTTATACLFCDNTGSCGGGSCPSNIKTTDNSTCSTPPSGWNCSASWYGDGECDCGCGTLDPDCTSILVSACLNCDIYGSCASGKGDCPANIKTTNNAICQ